jgi:hypothetical protein
MKRLVLAASALALCVAASSAARADYAVVLFKKEGYCRVWADTAAAPAGPGWKYHWVHLRSWEFAESKRRYAMRRHWCREFH